jgi:hypothetical protein
VNHSPPPAGHQYLIALIRSEGDLASLVVTVCARPRREDRCFGERQQPPGALMASWDRLKNAKACAKAFIDAKIVAGGQGHGQEAAEPSLPWAAPGLARAWLRG